MKTKHAILAASALLALVAVDLHAIDKTWDGSNSTSWANNNNWSQAGQPTLSDSALFGLRSEFPTEPAADGTASAGQVNFTGTGGWIISGNGSLSIGSGGIDNTGSGSNSVTVASLPVVAASTWTINPTTTVSVSGAITGNEASSITKDGTGKLVFSGSNSYAGATNISAGTVFINGNQAAASGAVSVTGNSFLGGIGTIGGVTTVDAGATLAPGEDAAGVLTFANDLTLNSTSTQVIMEINSTVRGSGYDGVDLTSGSFLTYNGDMVLNISTGLVDGTTLDLFSFNTPDLGTFDSILLTGMGTYAGPFVLQSPGIWTANSNAQSFTFTESTGDLTVGTGVPEPTTVVLFGIGAVTLLWRARRR